jgi:hypothetical protein
MITIVNVIYIGLRFWPVLAESRIARPGALGAGERASKRHSASNCEACLFVAGSALPQAINANT